MMVRDADSLTRSDWPLQQTNYFFWVLLWAMLVLAILGVHWHIGTTLSKVTAPLAHASVDIKYKLASFHLSLEELLQNSPEASRQKTWQYLTDAIWHIQAMLNGGSNEDGTYLPITVGSTRLLLTQTVTHLRSLEEMALGRLARHDRTGSENDQLFNHLYDQVINNAEQVHAAVRQEIMHQERVYQIVGLGFAGLLLALSLGMWLLLHAKESRHKIFEKRIFRLARIVEQAVNEIYLFDALSLRLVMINESGRENLRCQDNLSGLTFLDILPEFSAERFAALLQPLRDKSKPFIQFETIQRRMDGSSYDVHVELQFMADERDAPLFVAFVQDITQQNQVRKNLVLQETAMRAAANTIVITDRMGTIQWANPAFTSSTGYSLAEAIGQNPRILKSDLQDASFYRELWNTILTGQVWQGVFINRRKDGQLVHEEATITPVFDEALGVIVNFVAVKQDVTKRVQAEQELREAKRRAEATSQAKSDFLATMSHEIRTPLNSVLGMLELLKESDLQQTHQEQVQLALGSGKLLLYLINDILDYSKIEANQLVLDNIHFNLRTLLETIALNMSPLAHAKQVELTCFFPQELPVSVCGDPNRLAQIFTNLIGNAIKFTPEGGVVEFHGGPVSRGNGKIEFLFEIRDTGVGVPEAEREHIFERFAQVNTSSTRQYGGTGLGLAICQRLVEQMNGQIGVDDNSFAHSGSIFHFTVELQEQKEPAAGVQQSPLCELPLLIVGSHGLQAALLRNALHLWGVHYAEINELQAARLEMAEAVRRKMPYRLVIINLKPGQEWLPTLHLLRAAHRDASFLLLMDRLERERVTSQLPSDSQYLNKPFSIDQLHATLCSLLQLNDQAAPPLPALSSPRLALKTAAILVADDQTANLAVTLGMLAKLGCDRNRCVKVSNGQEAVERFQQGMFDIVFMDCQMPVMDGYQATRLIRAWEQQRGRPPVPIIAFTADATHANRQAVEAAGMNDFLTKPVSLAGFQQVLDRHLFVVGDAHTTPEDAMMTEMRSISEAMQAAGFELRDGTAIIQLILQQTPTWMATLEQELRAANYEQVRATSHLLCGSMIHLFFPEMRQETGALHEAVREQKWDEVSLRLARIREAYDSIQPLLSNWLEEIQALTAD
ncbi:MAG: ATP-binding protein [Magnetococcus sp. YQC-3]